MNMYCKKCGKQIDNDSKYCNYCGTKQSFKIEEKKEDVDTNFKETNKSPEIKNQVRKIEIFFGIPKSIIILYLIWFSIHLFFLLISDHNSYGERFWPFSSRSDLDDYDFSEFFLYILLPFIGIVIYGIIGSTNNNRAVAKNEKYDNSYKMGSNPTIVGIIIIIVNFIFLISGIKIEKEIYVIFSMISFGLRIGIIIWCVNIATKLNRNQTGWAIFALFLPAIALIFIGLQKKLLYSKNYHNKTNEEKSSDNNNIAYRKANEKQYTEALNYSNISIKLNPYNHAAYDTRGYIKYILKDFNGALEDLNKSIKLDSDHAVKFYHRGYIHKELGNIEEAMEDWNTAAEMGFEQAKIAIENNIE